MGDISYFRYMGPLNTDASCLQCHAKQGYNVGDIRGGISVSFDVQGLEGKLRSNLLAIIGLAILTTSLLVGLAADPVPPDDGPAPGGAG